MYGKSGAWGRAIIYKSIQNGERDKAKGNKEMFYFMVTLGGQQKIDISAKFISSVCAYVC